MLVFVVFLGYIFGFLIGAIYVNFILHITDNYILMILWGGLIGGIFAVAAATLYWLLLNPAIKAVIKASRTGFLIVALGKDRKVRLLPGESDGFILKPKDKRYRRYRWGTDGESLHPVHDGRGLQLAIAYMGASHAVDGTMAAAATKFAEMGFETIDDLKTATELPSIEAVDRRINELQEYMEKIAEMDSKDVEEKLGEDKNMLLAKLKAELERLARIREIVAKHGGGGDISVNIDGTIVRANDVIRYFAWKTDPALVEKIITAETNAAYARTGRWSVVAPYLGLIAMGIIGGLIILGAIYLIGHGHGAPSVVPHVVQNITHTVAHTPPANTTTTPPPPTMTTTVYTTVIPGG